MSQQYDLVIIGLGSGGTVAAEFASPQVDVPEDVRARAAVPIERMLELSA